ncbi:MAG: phosphoadenylyl-sulfate reductase, partial [Bacteroidota bacterium]
YHFPETIVHKNNVASLLGLHVIDLHPRVPKHLQRSAAGNLLFTFDPDYCCYLNKVQPVEGLLSEYDIWINGIRADQSPERTRLKEFVPTGARAVRYHPMLHWTFEDIQKYIEAYNLPRHPLEAAGYPSIGCEPCTKPVNGNDQRGGRWFGMRKTECGLNIEKSCCEAERKSNH